MTTKHNIAALERLLAAATQGEHSEMCHDVVVERDSGFPTYKQIEVVNNGFDSMLERRLGFLLTADQEAYIAIRNAAPDLLRVVREAQRLLDSAVEVSAWCGRVSELAGLRAALAAFEVTT